MLVLVSVTLITFDERSGTHHLTSGLKTVAHDVFSPLTTGVNDLLRPIGDFFAGAVHYGALQSENQKLQATVGRLRQEQEEKGFEKNQLRNVMALQNLPFLDGLTKVTAQTQEIYTSNFTMTITIDKGRADGVDVDMPVVGAGGLVGQVIQSFHHTAVVQLITDGQSKVGVTFGSANLTGTIDGQGPVSPMTADLIAPHTALTKGEPMYTSSLDGAAFPPGIPVARVTSFHTGAGASQETVTVTPIANLHQLAYVDVVVWEPPA